MVYTVEERLGVYTVAERVDLQSRGTPGVTQPRNAWVYAVERTPG